MGHDKPTSTSPLQPCPFSAFGNGGGTTRRVACSCCCSADAGCAGPRPVNCCSSAFPVRCFLAFASAFVLMGLKIYPEYLWHLATYEPKGPGWRVGPYALCPMSPWVWAPRAHLGHGPYFPALQPGSYWPKGIQYTVFRRILASLPLLPVAFGALLPLARICLLLDASLVANLVLQRKRFISRIRKSQQP